MEVFIMTLMAGALFVVGIAGEILKEIIASTIADDIRERLHKRKKNSEKTTVQTKHLYEQIDKQVEIKSVQYNVDPKQLKAETERFMDSLVKESNQFSYAKSGLFHKELNIVYDPNNPKEVQLVFEKMLRLAQGNKARSQVEWNDTSSSYDINDPNEVKKVFEKMRNMAYNSYSDTTETHNQSKNCDDYSTVNTDCQDINNYFVPVASDQKNN